MSLLIPLSDPAALDVATTGGKGASLAALVRRGLPVPDGVVVATDAYRAFAAALPDEEWEALRTVDAADVVAVRAACERLRGALEALLVAPALDAELRAWVAAAAARGVAAFAVRSSATAEDTAGAAFAGQHDTFLDCRDADEVVARVKACWLSLWQERAVAYRARVGVPHDGVAMAVVVQEMVECDVAGVAFTLDPLTGALDRVVVSANFGIGESVVAGEGDVDHFALDKRTLRVVEARVAAKRSRVVATGHGTVVEHVSAREASRRSLSDDDLRRLGELLRRVEDGAPHRWPQDVEWGMRGGALVLLQARPVTVVPPRWTRDESAERFPNAVTPFAWDFVEDGFHRSLAHSLALMGLPPLAGKWFALFGHHVYGDQNAVERYARAAAPAVPPAGELAAALPALVRRYGWLRRLPHEWHAALPRYLAAVEALRAEPLDGRPVAELWNYVERVSAVGSEYFLPNIAISLGHGLLHRSLGALLAATLGDADGARLAADLTACETQTARVNAELRALAAAAAAHGTIARELRTADSRAVLRRATGSEDSAFWRAFRAFLDAHGHRETDFDPYHPTWAEAPWVVLDHVRAMLDAPAAVAAPPSTADIVARLRRAEAELGERMPRRLRPFALELARLARAYTALDDLEHYHTTRLALPLRRGVRALGERVARAGLVAEPLDLFFARREELAAAVAAGEPRAGVAAWSTLAAQVARAKAAYERDRASTPAWEWGRTAARVAPAAADGALRGVPGSPGVAEGRVCVVRSPEDFARFPRGAVLVARTTNPAWTPLFYGAAAVVTESGGPLSHGAVTAREMHVPAVMAVRDAIAALPDGTRVRVDGAAGTVEILGAPDDARATAKAHTYLGGRDHVVTTLS